MLSLTTATCDSCGKQFECTMQLAQFYCARCGKEFVLCPNCREGHECDYCGGTELLDVYKYHEKKTGKTIFF